VTPGGNVAVDSIRDFDEDLPACEIAPAELRPYLTAPAVEAGQDDRAVAQLDALVRQTIGEGVDGWAPWIVQLGVSGEQAHFARTAETIQALSLALPHLSAPTREAALAHLDAMFAAGAPLDARSAHGGARREYYQPGPTMLAAAPALMESRVEAAQPVEDLYAVWAYAHYGDRWQAVLARRDAIRRAFRDSLGAMGRFTHADPDRTDAAERLNRQIAGVLAYARIMDRAGEADEVNRALAALASLVSQRVHHERADRDFVRVTPTTSHQRGHAAKIPRYVGLTPELGAMLAEFAGDALATNLRNIDRDLPIWHGAWGERLIGGENYVSPPDLAYGLFTAFAYGAAADEEELAGWIDQPWVRADLYQIEKLAAMLRR
jgi:hypothetical protein